MVSDRGNVWWGPAPQKPGPSYRPWVIVSDDEHPFSHTECVVVAMTTQRHAEGIAVPDSAWVEGGSETDSYISPWYVATMKHADLDRRQGKLAADVVSESVRALREYVPVHTD